MSETSEGGAGAGEDVAQVELVPFPSGFDHLSQANPTT
jgi:hypothetical protein